jgi:hypothetical protein
MMALASRTRVRQRRRSSSSTCTRDQNASIMALRPLCQDGLGAVRASRMSG